MGSRRSGRALADDRGRGKDVLDGGIGACRAQSPERWDPKRVWRRGMAGGGVCALQALPLHSGKGLTG